VAGARTSQRSFLGLAALLFAASAAVTVAWCGAMSEMGGMAMPGGWTMSMAWMRMPGQGWSAAAAGFLAMWTVMMVAMMLPSLVPMLLRYRQAVGAGRAGGAGRLGRLTALVGLAYFAVWSAVGAAAYPLGVALAAVEMQHRWAARLVPLAVGLVVLAAGALQFSGWKARRLACCREAPGPLPADAATAWRHGLRLGLRCAACCAGPTAVLLVLGVMDLGAMALATAAISAERLAPRGVRVARAIGVVCVGAGGLLVARSFRGG